LNSELLVTFGVLVFSLWNNFLKSSPQHPLFSLRPLGYLIKLRNCSGKTLLCFFLKLMSSEIEILPQPLYFHLMNTTPGISIAILGETRVRIIHYILLQFLATA